MMFRPSYAEISRKALEHNLKLLLSMTQNSFFCPMVKANAYGHGAVEVVQFLKKFGIQCFGVSLYEEAMELRNAGIDDVQVLVFSPLFQGVVDIITEHDITPVICSYQDFERLQGCKKELKVHIKFNVGMARLGFSLSDAATVKRQVLEAGLSISGVCTHLASAEDLGSANSETKSQLNEFMRLTDIFGKDVFYHALNSDALLMHKQLDPEHRKLLGARPGISLYGYPNLKTEFEFQPVMAVKTKLAHVLNIQQGEGVSYGPSWRAERDTKVGVLPIGYADGLSRKLSNHHGAYVDEIFCPLIGTICMDYCMLDLTDLEMSNDDLYKASVRIIGGSGRVAIDKIADSLDTISYEILTGISERVPRVYA